MISPCNNNVQHVLDLLILRASSLGLSGGGVGKGRRACNYFSGIGISVWKKLMWNADWQRWHLMTSLPLACAFTCFSMFVYVRVGFHFVLIFWRKSHHSVDGSYKGIVWGIQISKDVIASSPSLSHRAARSPQRASSLAKTCTE